MTRARAWMRRLGSLAAAAAASGAAAQQSPAVPGDSLRLGALVQQALAADPRHAQLDLYARQADLRLRTIAAERLPSFRGEGEAQYQSDVVHIPIELPSGQRIPSPTRDTYDVHVGVEESLFDPSRAPRAAVERA
ncbi:MAG: hypothetical protein IRY91_00510, partial [Gemmatimonadaceae bacterium]|nr:hypothetical protein [Gemmatimonadaceae bacterium]